MSDAEYLLMCLLAVCLLLKNICLNLMHIFDWVVCFSDIELYELLIYFRD